MVIRYQFVNNEEIQFKLNKITFSIIHVKYLLLSYCKSHNFIKPRIYCIPCMQRIIEI